MAGTQPPVDAVSPSAAQADEASAGDAQADDQAQWMSASERSSVWIIQLMVWLSLLCGRRVSRLILRGIAAYFLLANGAARRASQQYLQRVLGRAPRWAERYRHFFAFASVIHDRIYLLKNRSHLFDIRIVGLQPLLDAVAERTPIMLFGSHLGSFELLRVSGQQHGVEVAMLMYAQNARKLNAVLERINPDFAKGIIHLNHIGSMLEAKAAMDEGQILGMLADRGLGGGRSVRHDFLGTPASFPLNPFRLAALLECRVFFMSGLYLGGNRYEAHIIPLGDFRPGAAALDKPQQQALMKQVETAYVDTLERLCRYAPYNWFNFYDFWQDRRAP